jgi:DNA-directed RNA polymerase subunit M/transcription elongation factor TFIIS
LSNVHPELLNFACPQCQKNLRAPSSLAGKKLACPKCSASIRVPGVISANNDDDDWLKLDMAEPVDEQPTSKPATSKPATSKPATSKPATSKPVRDPRSFPEKAITPVKEAAPSETSDTVTATGAGASTGAGSSTGAGTSAGAGNEADTGNEDDEFRLEPVSPPSKVSRSVFEDDFPDLIPTESSPTPATRPSELNAVPSAKKKTEPKKMAQPGSSGNSKHEPSSNATDSSKPKPLLVGSLDEVILETPALGDSFVVPNDEEFRYACKICGTFLYANKSRIGSKTRCPDCHSQFVVPKPFVKPIPKEFKLEEMPSVRFAPIDAENSKASSHQDVNTREILERAKVEADREREELEEINFVFDTKRWMGLILGFLRDPMVVIAMVILGLVSSAWFFSMAAFGSVIEVSEKTAFVARVVIFAVFLLPIGGIICLCGLPVLVMAANRAPRVSEWPFSRLGESIGECMMVIVTLVIASIPGGMLGALTTSLGANPLIAAGAVMLGIWGLSPILLLSMINNSSAFEPYSQSVIGTIKNYGDAWGAMYIQSGIAYALFFIFMAVASLDGVGGDIVCGLVLPFFAFFIFNQLGVLAGRISQATEMGFEGDFSGD